MYGTVRCGMTVSAKIMMWDYMEGRRRVEGEKLCVCLVFFCNVYSYTIKVSSFLTSGPFERRVSPAL